jgi:hypothetical protein
MGWLLAIAAVVALVALKRDDTGGGNVIVPPPPASQGDALIMRIEADSWRASALGWSGWAWVPLNSSGEIPSVYNFPGSFRGPFASAAQARAGLLGAGYREVTEVGVPSEDQQGGGAPVVPPLPAAPYLIVRSPPVSGEARASTTEVRWTVYAPDGTTTDATANAITANATLLARVNSKAPLNNTVRIELRKANGATLRSVVSEVVEGWRWTLDTPAGPNAAGSSVSQPSWVANNRLAAMRAALTTLQNA